MEKKKGKTAANFGLVGTVGAALQAGQVMAADEVVEIFRTREEQDLLRVELENNRISSRAGRKIDYSRAQKEPQIIAALAGLFAQLC